LASEFSAHPSRRFAHLLPGTAAQHEYNNAYSAFSKLQNPPKASWKAQISGEMQLRTPAAINLLRAATVLSLVSVWNQYLWVALKPETMLRTCAELDFVLRSYPNPGVPRTCYTP